MKILIVEDEMLIAESLRKMLSPTFAVTGIAASFEEAVRSINCKMPDAALIDIAIQGDKNGLDLAKEINYRYKIPFIFLTANTEPQTIEKILELQPEAYLSKPVKKVNLITALKIVQHKLPAKKFSIKVGAKDYQINLSELQYVESDHVYLLLYFVSEKPLLLRTTMQNFLSQIPEGILTRINRSVAINGKYIENSCKTEVQLAGKTFKISSKFSDSAS